MENFRDKHAYIEYSESRLTRDESDVPPLAGGKRGRFAKVSVQDRRNGNAGQFEYFVNINDAFVPPKPKELVMAVSTAA